MDQFQTELGHEVPELAAVLFDEGAGGAIAALLKQQGQDPVRLVDAGQVKDEPSPTGIVEGAVRDAALGPVGLGAASFGELERVAEPLQLVRAQFSGSLYRQLGQQHVMSPFASVSSRSSPGCTPRAVPTRATRPNPPVRRIQRLGLRGCGIY
ncbi:hypothetical protein RIF23_15195 [Lipingzhangella sp. LS1_29]|uniref:Uncharacterized protein n=1 Tax=Lipingzhangella rawalii TaxID=2055835 RepID=A0ABU2H9X8_9ACTN|nr:hypothetical protein [Lipingzhangella rawalii]MDS1271640.1 hypothetical protein [Lipingzhangella rawalii]